MLFFNSSKLIVPSGLLITVRTSKRRNILETSYFLLIPEFEAAKSNCRLCISYLFLIICIALCLKASGKPCGILSIFILYSVTIPNIKPFAFSKLSSTSILSSTTAIYFFSAFPKLKSLKSVSSAFFCFSTLLIAS